MVDYSKNKDIKIFKNGETILLNIMNEKLTGLKIQQIKEDDLVVLIYDTDVNKTNILEYNISFFKSLRINNIIHVQSVENFEDELIYSCNIKNVNEIFKTTKVKEFKSKFIKCKNIKEKLKEIDFNGEKIWSRKSKDKNFIKFTETNNYSYKC